MIFPSRRPIRIAFALGILLPFAAMPARGLPPSPPGETPAAAEELADLYDHLPLLPVGEARDELARLEPPAGRAEPPALRGLRLLIDGLNRMRALRAGRDLSLEPARSLFRSAADSTSLLRCDLHEALWAGAWGDWAGALNRFQKIRGRAEREGDREAARLALLGAAGILSRFGNRLEAARIVKDLYDSEVNEAEREGGAPSPRFLLLLAERAAGMGDAETTAGALAALRRREGARFGGAVEGAAGRFLGRAALLFEAPSEAIGPLRKAVAFYRAAGDARGENASALDLAEALLLAGKIEEAAGALAASEGEATRIVPLPDRSRRAGIEARIDGALGHAARARETLEREIERLDSLGRHGEATRNREALVSLLQERGEREAAEEIGLVLLEEHVSTADTAAAARRLIGLAENASSMNDPERALRFCDDAEPLLAGDRSAADLGAGLALARSHALLRLGRASEAREILASLPLDEIGDETRIRLLEAQAVAARETGDRAGAIRLLRAAVTGAEEALASRSLHPFREKYFGEHAGLYRALLALLLDEDRRAPDRARRAEAVGLLEGIKARTLADLIDRGNVRREGRDLVRSYDRLNEKLRNEFRIRYYRMLLREAGGGPSDPDLVERFRRELEREKEARPGISLRYDVASGGGRRRSRRAPPLAPLDPATVCAALAPGETLVDYFVDESSLYILLFRGDSLRIFRRPVTRDSLRREVRALVAPLRRPRNLADIPFSAARARALYAILLRPVERFLPPGGPLVLLPDDVLFHLPFEMLLAEPAGGARWSREGRWEEAPFLVREHPVRYAYSAALALALDGAPGGGAAPEGAPGPPLVLADPALPSAGEELAAVRACAGREGGVYLSGEEATERALKERLPGAGLLHVASHGRFFDTRPLDSRLLLRPSEGMEDGYVEAWELLDLRTNADLVFLSGCETGRGEVRDGAGLVGLSQAFLAAGARSLVVTLWSVDDAASSRLVRRFYCSGAGNGAAALAARLREAKLRLIEEGRETPGGGRLSYAHPYFWAPFVLYSAGREPMRDVPEERENR